MEVQEQRRIAERRAADQRSAESRRIDKARRYWNRRQDARGSMTEGGEFDRRGAYPSLFASLGYTLLRGVRRIVPIRRNVEVRRSFMRRSIDRRAL